MEVLNQNQRRSAMWRIVALGVIIIALLATILCSMHIAYASLGHVDFEELQAKYDKESKIWKGVKMDLDNKNNNLKKELKECQDNANVDEDLKKCQDDLKFTEKRMVYLEKDLDRCKQDLITCKSF